jgi:glycosyltransferase involved in cell wall biosynthesis
MVSFGSRLSVSVIMPLKNAQPYVARAIASVLSQQGVDDDLE